MDETTQKLRHFARGAMENLKVANEQLVIGAEALNELVQASLTDGVLRVDDEGALRTAQPVMLLLQGGHAVPLPYYAVPQFVCPHPAAARKPHKSRWLSGATLA